MLSLLTAESSAQDLPLILCYYINNTANTQVIRVMNAAVCRFERIVYAKERILFEAPSDSYMEIYSSLLGGARLTRADCKSFQVYEKEDAVR
ncbi:DUF1830 domain-containing protein [Leptolyngbya sp. CCNP1308]|uniref:DUF1830 domain-containing protein n=1 Tax=Leptolyngbya sp. CCNP1308 TaxID=3110255 RepID=UPI002B20C670|nr:DUF1830 domain-containing protein [Leptolyngbya sp. CCNP1308]MEA5451583.1 DUF1830 domain-containing protein [Leptolyngbya sp. CCNP1308]